MTKLFVLDSIGSFSLSSYLETYIKEKSLGCEVWKMANLFTEPMWGLYKQHSPEYVFVDFCNENAIILTNRVKDLPQKPKIVIRLHGYEAMQPDGRYVKQIDWSAVSALVVVSPVWNEVVTPQIPAMAGKIHVIPNGIDLQKFQLQRAEDMGSSKIAYAGFQNLHKGMTLLRTAMYSLPDKHLHMAGRYQDKFVQAYMEDQPPPNMTYHGWVDVAEFFKGKRFVISTSIQETFGMSIAEGMACGLTPLVHHWPGADEIWPPECCWKSFEELRAILASPKDPSWCRSWIEDRYSMDNCIKKIASLIF